MVNPIGCFRMFHKSTHSHAHSHPPRLCHRAHETIVRVIPRCKNHVFLCSRACVTYRACFSALVKMSRLCYHACVTALVLPRLFFRACENVTLCVTALVKLPFLCYRAHIIATFCVSELVKLPRLSVSPRLCCENTPLALPRL